jgi:hypothetical protein
VLNLLVSRVIFVISGVCDIPCTTSKAKWSQIAVFISVPTMEAAKQIKNYSTNFQIKTSFLSCIDSGCTKLTENLLFLQNAHKFAPHISEKTTLNFEAN